MTLLQWAREKIFGHGRDAFAEAIDATDDATIKTRSLREQLEPFRLDDDPFASIIRKRIMTDGYESAQISSIYRGPLS